MLAFECSNPLFGTTNNPYDPIRTCGGSSGGEAALLSSDGAPLGFGSDIGGSLRIPVHYSGCFGLKPCAGRFPDAGAKNPNPGFEGIKTTLGPMGRSVDDLELAMRVVADASIALARTHPLIPLAYREVLLPAKLKFGYYLTGTQPLLPPVVLADLFFPQTDSVEQVLRASEQSWRLSQRCASLGTSAKSSFLRIVSYFRNLAPLPRTDSGSSQPLRHSSCLSP